MVDDDPRTLKIVRDALAGAGYDPIVTGDPGEAIELMDETEIDVVLLDMMFPDHDGIELMRDVFAHHDAPVIFLSAYDQRDLIVRAFEMGAVEYIAKPFSPSELAARVKAALRKKLGDQANNPKYIHTVPQVGYRMPKPDTTS